MASARQLLEAAGLRRSDERFHQPENFDKVEEGKGWVLMVGGNDWEACATTAAAIFSHPDGDSDRIWIKLKFPKELEGVHDSELAHKLRDKATAHAEKMWKAWLAAARACHKADEFGNWKRAFEEAAKSGSDFAEEWGIDHTVWKATAESIVDRLISPVRPRKPNA